MTGGAADVRHEPDRTRFVMTLDGADSVLQYRAVDAATVEYYHTFVPRELRGRGLASRLTAGALRHAADNGWKVVPTCPFVAAYLERHPDLRAAVS
jgi:hypothetical protein